MQLSIKQLRVYKTLGLLALFVAPLYSHAMPDDKDKPIEMVADAADINEATNTSIYSGDVVLDQGTMQVKADTVTMYQKEDQPSKMVAVGQPVKFKQNTKDGWVYAHAKRIEYYEDGDEVTLIGKAWIKQAGDTMQTDRIVWNRAKSVIKAGKSAKGKSRVKFVIKQKKDK